MPDSEAFAAVVSKDVIDMRGMSLKQIEDAAIRACYERCNGHRRTMMAELGISKSGLMNKLAALGLRMPRPRR